MTYEELAEVVLTAWNAHCVGDDAGEALVDAMENCGLAERRIATVDDEAADGAELRDVSAGKAMVALSGAGVLVLGDAQPGRGVE